MPHSNTLIFNDPQTDMQSTVSNHSVSKPMELKDLIVDKDFLSVFENRGFDYEIYIRTIFRVFFKLPSLNEYLFQLKMIDKNCGFIFPYVNTECPLHLETDKINFNINAESLGIAISLFALNMIYHLYPDADQSLYYGLLEHAKKHKNSKIISQLGSKFIHGSPKETQTSGSTEEKDVSVACPPYAKKEPEMEL